MGFPFGRQLTEATKTLGSREAAEARVLRRSKGKTIGKPMGKWGKSIGKMGKIHGKTMGKPIGKWGTSIYLLFFRKYLGTVLDMDKNE